MSEARCSDCLDEFRDRKRYAVIEEDTTRTYDEEERLLGAHLHLVLVCQDCVGWYRNAVEAE